LKSVRVHFEKTGRAKYISHLDLNRTMTRALRRAALPVWYTEGFNRHPYITFAAPLSLGYEGLRECMDFRLEEEIPDGEVVDRLNAVMPEGLRIVDCGEARMKPADLAAARWRLWFDCPRSALEALLAADQILVEKRTKKKQLKQIDIRPYLIDPSLTGDEEGVQMEVTLPCSGETTVNPALIQTALGAAQNQPEIAMRAVRLQLLSKNNTPFC
jgi:radical SAM-linked protein